MNRRQFLAALGAVGGGGALAALAGRRLSRRRDASMPPTATPRPPLDLPDRTIAVSRTPPQDPAPGTRWLLPEPYLDATWQGEYFDLDNGPNPMLFDRRHFDDNQYRLLHGQDGRWEVLWKTPDFETWTLVDRSAQDGGHRALGDGIIVDGTVYFVGSAPKRGIVVRAGPSLTRTRVLGHILPTKNDPGLCYDPDTHTIHLYTEGRVRSSPRIAHYTAPLDDPLDVTWQGAPINTRIFTGNDAGDPELVNMGDRWLMVVDNKINHPTYRLAVYESRDLYSWRPLRRALVSRYGGDWTGVRVPREEFGTDIVSFVEFAGPDRAGIGKVHVRYFPPGVYRRQDGGWRLVDGDGR